MRYDLIQNSIRGRLEAAVNAAFPPPVPLPANYIPAVRVIDQPQTQDGLPTAYTSALMVVSFIGSEYQDDLSTDNVQQVETINIDVRIRARSLYDNAGLHRLVTLTRLALMGFRPEVAGKKEGDPMSFAALDMFESLERGVFECSARFKTRRLVVSQDEPLSLPTLITLIYQTPVAQIVVQ